MKTLSQCVETEVPRNVAQEVLAEFFSFESWQHLIARVKDRQAIVQQPFMLAKSDRKKADYESVTYVKGVAAAFFMFGQRLNREQRKTFTWSPGSHLHISNFTENNAEAYQRTKDLYQEDTGVSLSEMRLVYPDSEYCYLAATMLDASCLESAIKEYLYTDMDQHQRIVRLNTRNGVKPEDNIFLGEWVYYINRSTASGLFAADRIHETVKTSGAIGSSLDKAALVKVGREYWLATDWDRRPEYQLPGLDDAGAERLKQKFNIEVIRLATG